MSHSQYTYYVIILGRGLCHDYLDNGRGGEGSELQKVGILVSEIPDISGRKSGHFQIVPTYLSKFGIKGSITLDFTKTI